MPTYKLIYFNVKARAEAARYLFALAGVEYDDYRLKDGEWPTVKPSTPFGQVPLLEIDGVRLCQSITIARYLAKQFGYAGKTDLESAQCDMIVDSLEDARSTHVHAFFYEKDEAKKAEMKKKFAEEQYPESLARFQKLLCANKGGDGYFVGDGLTWADVNFALNIDFITDAVDVPLCLDKFPKLSALRERVNSEPRIAEWRAKRPATKI